MSSEFFLMKINCSYDFINVFVLMSIMLCIANVDSFVYCYMSFSVDALLYPPSRICTVFIV